MFSPGATIVSDRYPSAVTHVNSKELDQSKPLCYILAGRDLCYVGLSW